MPSEEIAQRGHKPLAFSPERAARHAELMGFLYERFYLSPTVVSSREVAEEALSEIVSHYQQRPGALPLAYRRRLESQGLARTVCDYAAGMTDRYALDAWRRLVEQRLARGPVDDRTLDHRAEGDASDEQQLGHGAEGDAPDEQLAGHGSTPATDDGETAAPTPLDTEMEAAVASLCERIGHGFVDAGLAAMALTHASARSASRPPNERLEFLGDAVLGMVVVRECYLRFPTLPEGELSRIKATTVNRHALHAVAERWALRPLLRLGQGFREGDKVPHSIVADAVEAVLGAVYLDGGMSAADALIRREFGAQIDLAAEGHRGSNAKSELQTFTQGRLGLTPNYRLLDESGPDHAKLFTVAAMLGHRELAVGRGRNKRQAEQRAAQRALRLLMAEASEDRPPLPVDPADRQDHGARPD